MSRGTGAWGAAPQVVALSLVTSSAAHVDAGGLLPRPSGCGLLLLGMAMLWLVSARTTRSLAGLVANLSIGQLLCHLCYQVGTMPAPTLLVGAGGGQRWRDPMSGAQTMCAMSGMHAMSGTSGMVPMPGAPGGAAMPGAMGTGTMAMGHGSHGALAMLVAHAAAVLASAALVLALRHLPQATREWLRTVLPEAPVLVPTLALRQDPTYAPIPRPHHAHAPPPPRRGPPLPHA